MPDVAPRHHQVRDPDRGKPVRAEVAEHVSRPFQVFEQAKRGAVARHPHRARPGDVQRLCHASSLAAGRARQ
jgi:hypothetical protein